MSRTARFTEGGSKALSDAGASERGRQEAHEGDAQLDGREQTPGFLGHAPDPPGTLVTLFGELADTAATHRDQGDSAATKMPLTAIRMAMTMISKRELLHPDSGGSSGAS